MNNVAALGLFALALLLLAGAIALVRGGRRLDIHQAVWARFRNFTTSAADTAPRDARRHAVVDWWARKLQRAGLEVSRKTSWLIFGPFAAAVAVAGAGWGVKGLWIPAAVALALHLYLEHRARLRRDAMLAQLPGFVDHIIRGLSTGRTVESTLLLATQHCRPPLRDVLERVRVNVELGARLSDELQQAAQIHRLRELQLLALAVHVNQRFGGSARELLHSIVTMIQQRDQAQRELRAMTGETRLSAWVLGLLPVGVAVYMMAMNPGYLETMWQEPGGRNVLLTALALQGIGGVALWRMVRSL